MLLAGAVQVNALAQGAVWQFTQWLWIEHPTFHLGGGHLATELLPPHIYFVSFLEWSFSHPSKLHIVFVFGTLTYIVSSEVGNHYFENSVATAIAIC